MADWSTSPASLLPLGERDQPKMREQLKIEKLTVEIEKARADRKKAELEAARLKNPWYLRPEILQPIAAIVIGVVTGIAGYVSGFFQTKLDSLKLQQQQARLALDDLNNARSGLRAQLAALQRDYDSVNTQLSVTLAKADALEREYKSAALHAKEGDRLRVQLEALRKQLRSNVDNAHDTELQRKLKYDDEIARQAAAAQ